VIEGKLRGNLQCEDSMTIQLVGKIPGRIAAQSIVVERKSDIQCFRRVMATNIDIKGRMSAEIVATGSVTIHKTGSLEGNVTAKSIAIEKGGMFSGQLVIGQVSLTQGELLPEAKASTPKGESDVPMSAAHPAHAI
jgi:cytoskeletal protein CcmA (bactofilin family)